MNRIIYLIPLLSLLGFVTIKTDATSLVKRVENKIISGQCQIAYLPDSSQPYACDAVIYFDSTGLQKLEIGCGDGSLEMHEQHFYFKNNIPVYVLSKRFYFNAPPTYTEEVARKEGLTSGWFDSTKTHVTKLKSFYEKGKLVRMIDGQEEIPLNHTMVEKEDSMNSLQSREALKYYEHAKGE